MTCLSTCHSTLVFIQAVAKADGHLSTGIVGTRFLFESLAEHGFASVALTAMSQKTYPSYGYMIGQGATTLWEHWEGTRYGAATGSRNHIMYGGHVSFLYKHVAGIAQAEGAYGWTSIVFRPGTLLDPTVARSDACARLASANASLAPMGAEISVSWACEVGAADVIVHINATVPVGAVGTVYVPAASAAGVTLNGAPVKAGTSGVVSIAMGTGLHAKAVLVRVLSGAFAFRGSP